MVRQLREPSTVVSVDREGLAKLSRNMKINVAIALIRAAVAIGAKAFGNLNSDS